VRVVKEGARGPFRYRADILDALSQHGVRPRADTPPELVLEFVSDLYRHQLRCLRERLRRGEFPRHEYLGRVVDLRRRYRILSARPSEWLE